MPENIQLGEDVYIESSYAFAGFHSERQPGLLLGDASGVYDRAAFIVGARGKVRVGAFTILNGTYIVCDDSVEIGEHCLLSWGVVITDNWLGAGSTRESRREALLATTRDPLRHPPAFAEPRPVVIEDNSWVGFDSVIMPGVTLGRGCIVGCKSIVYEDVPPYAVVAGDPARFIRQLDPDDTDDEREKALAELTIPEKRYSLRD
jgi:acetyltransferase-like isoleucine patch superfamily enzyme